MSGNFIKEDLRIVKTRKSLLNAIEALLERRSFKHVTVNDLCEEALLSRAAFYTHFKDKYDLLDFWLTTVFEEIASGNDILQNITNSIVYNNYVLIRNLIDGVDDETLGLVRKFGLSLFDKAFGKTKKDRDDPNYRVLSNFCVGGCLELMLWQVKNAYPADFRKTKKYFQDLSRTVIEWSKPV
ncbi:MAG: TetR/AcrR family transcriptional regulator [Clostridiales bacterium]|nr:TetR/AcrR family transcriptional regulator [Clostridiales bacterium]